MGIGTPLPRSRRNVLTAFAGALAGAAAASLATAQRVRHPSSRQVGDLFLDRNERLWPCQGGTSWFRLA